MEKLVITAVVALMLALVGLFVSMAFEPTGFKVSCEDTAFSMPAGTMANAQNAAKEHKGCTIEKMKF